MKLTFLGAAHEVTGSCSLLETGGAKYLIDCGMEQGADIYENSELPVLPAEINGVFLTHAHIDHSGKLPLLFKNGFSGQIYSTDATMKLCSIMLADSAHIQETEAIWKNRRAKRSGDDGYVPLYTVNDANATMRLFSHHGYGEKFNVAGNITAEFFDAGHLLGSSGIRLTLTENGITKQIVFSGDIGNKSRPLICDPSMPGKADYAVIESTYGDREHTADKNDREEQLSRIIAETLGRGGNLIIPSFAVGRTQELLYMIRRIKERGTSAGDFPVWLDSPLAIEATNIYSSDMSAYFDSEALKLLENGINPIGFSNLNVAVSADESKQINFDKTPKVIISASGMCEAGRIRHHLKYNLWRQECTILFVGYQVEGTLGRRILDGVQYVSLFGEDIKVTAHIERLDGISAHADKAGLLNWLESMEGTPQKVFINHGADEVCDGFASVVSSELGLNATAPYSGDSYDLLTGEKLTEGNRIKIKRETAERRKNSSAVWSRLNSAGLRLMSLIEKSRGKKSRELIELTNRINTLCDKHEKNNKK